MVAGERAGAPAPIAEIATTLGVSRATVYGTFRLDMDTRLELVVLVDSFNAAWLESSGHCCAIACRGTSAAPVRKAVERKVRGLCTPSKTDHARAQAARP